MALRVNHLIGFGVGTGTAGGGSVSPTPTGFYAFVNKTADQSSFDTVAITWEAEVSDDQNVHDNSTNNSRFTIPAAWNNRYIRLTGNNVSNAIGGVLSTWKGGVDFVGMGRYDYAITAGNNACNLMSAPVLAVTGDYFEFQGTVNTGDLFANDGTWGQIELMPSDYNGALVKKTTAQSISAGTTTVLTWDAEEYDLDGWHDNATNNSRLTVPTGVSLVRVQAGFRGGNVTGQLVISFLKDGAGARGLPQNDTDSTGFDVVCAASAPIAVSATNYFEVRAFHDSATDIAADNMTWFSIHELPSDLKYALVNRSSNQALASGTTTIINWNAEVVDTDAWHTLAATVTITIASPGVVTWTGHDFAAGSPIVLTTTGALPTGLTAGTIYYVVNPASNTFQLATAPGGSAINTSGSQSGTHTATNGSRLIVPSGISKVRVGFNLITEASVTAQVLGELLKNGASFLGKARHETDTTGGDSVGGWSAIIDVTPGDFFEVQGFATNPINIGSNNASWFAIEEVRDAS